MKKESSAPPLADMPSVADVTAAVASEINRVREANVEALARARCIGYLAGVLLKSLEVAEIEIRLEALEKKMEGKDGGSREKQT